MAWSTFKKAASVAWQLYVEAHSQTQRDAECHLDDVLQLHRVRELHETHGIWLAKNAENTRLLDVFLELCETRARLSSGGANSAKLEDLSRLTRHFTSETMLGTGSRPPVPVHTRQHKSRKTDSTSEGSIQAVRVEEAKATTQVRSSSPEKPTIHSAASSPEKPTTHAPVPLAESALERDAKLVFTEPISRLHAVADVWRGAQKMFGDKDATYAQREQQFWLLVNNDPGMAAENVRLLLTETGCEIRGEQLRPQHEGRTVRLAPLGGRNSEDRRLDPSEVQLRRD